MMGVDKHFGGGQKDPFKLSNQALFSARSGAVHTGFHVRALLSAPWQGLQGGMEALKSGAQVSFLRLEGSPGWSGASILFQIGT